MTKQSFIQGTLILVIAGAFTKVLGFANRIVLSRIIGAEGMGLYQMAVPTLYLVITLTTFGLPIAISKLVAEAEAQGKEHKVRTILKLSILIVGTLSIFFTTTMITASPVIAKYMLTDERAFYSLVSIAPIVPIVAVSSVIRGYFQGRQNMIPSAISQMIEQSVRIFTVIFFTQLLLPKGVEYAAAGAMIGIVIGELAGMCVLLHRFRKSKIPKIKPANKVWKSIKNNIETFYGLLRIAIPVTSSRFIGSVTYALEPIIVAQSLAIAGIATGAATSLYGQLAGMAIPLITFPTFFTYSLSVSLVPAISEAASVKNYRLVHRRLNQAMRIALVIGAPCTVILYIFAGPLCEVVYGNREVSELLKIMVPFSLLLYFQGPLAAVLQGLDLAAAAMRNSIIGAVLKTGAIFLFATRPDLGIDGVAIAMNIGLLIVTLLHFVSISKAIGFTLPVKDFIKVGISMLGMGYAAHFLFAVFLNDSTGASLFFSSLAGSLLYVIFLFGLKVLGRQDIERIPWVGKRIAPFFPNR